MNDEGFEEIFRQASALAEMLQSASSSDLSTDSPQPKRRCASDTITIPRTSSRLECTESAACDSSLKRKLNLNETFDMTEDVVPQKRAKPSSDLNDNFSKCDEGLPESESADALDFVYTEREIDQLMGDFGSDEGVDVAFLKKSVFSNCDKSHAKALVAELEASAARTLVKQFQATAGETLADVTSSCPEPVPESCDDNYSSKVTSTNQGPRAEVTSGVSKAKVQPRLSMRGRLRPPVSERRAVAHY